MKAQEPRRHLRLIWRCKGSTTDIRSTTAKRLIKHTQSGKRKFLLKGFKLSSKASYLNRKWTPGQAIWEIHKFQLILKSMTRRRGSSATWRMWLESISTTAKTRATKCSTSWTWTSEHCRRLRRWGRRGTSARPSSVGPWPRCQRSRASMTKQGY